MTLLAAEGGNLLAISFSEEDGGYAVLVLNAMGEKTVVYDGYVMSAIVSDGRFYWGVGSCALDGSDVRLLIDDEDHSYNYCPAAVSGEWYFYLDWAENSETAFYEGTDYPPGGAPVPPEPAHRRGGHPERIWRALPGAGGRKPLLQPQQLLAL